MSDYYEHLVNNMSDGVLLMFYATGYSQPGSFASEAIAEAGVELLRRLRTRKEALERIADVGCESYIGGSCVDSHRTIDAEYGADRWCNQCVARQRPQ